jgi:hypothetical protein
MTFNDGWIKVLAGGASEPLDSARKGLERFGALESRPGWGDYWVPFVQAWATRRGLDIHYIDNCWLMVAVSAPQLVEFLQSIDQPANTWVAPLVARVNPADSYIIEAEEY